MNLYDSMELAIQAEDHLKCEKKLKDQEGTTWYFKESQDKRRV